MPLTVVAALGSVTVTCGAVVSGGGGDCDPEQHLDRGEVPLVFVGAVSSMATTVPAAGVGEVCDCAQKVSPLPVSTHWWRIVCPAPSARAVAPSQSLPAPKTHEPAAVVVSVGAGAPVAAPAPLDAPTPPAPAKAITVSDWS